METFNAFPVETKNVYNFLTVAYVVSLPNLARRVGYNAHLQKNGMLKNLKLIRYKMVADAIVNFMKILITT